MSFKTYNTQGQLLLDSEQSVFNFVKSGRLTRLFATPFEQNKREYWYRAKRLGFNSEMRKGQADIHTPEYCMYYIDLPNAISPIAGVYYDGLAKDCNPVVYLNTGYFDGMARLMFYSNGRLSNEELAKFHIYIFDVNVIKEDKVGINLYDRQGNITFSSRSMPMSMLINTIDDNIPDDIKKLSDEEAKVINNHINHYYDYGVDYYHNNTGSDAHIISKRKNYGSFLSDGIPIQSKNKKCAGILSPELIVGYYPKDSSELTTAIGDYDGFFQLKYHAGDAYPIISALAVFACVGCVDGASIKPTYPFSRISTNGKALPTNAELLQRRLVFNQASSFNFVDIDILPFPFH